MLARNQIHTIVNPKGAHAEERYGSFLLKKFGYEILPGCETAKLEYWDIMPRGTNPEGLEASGYVLVGMGYGRYDEHLSPGSLTERRKDQSAAKLIAHDLCLQYNPLIMEMVNRLTVEDQTGAGAAFAFPAMIKKLNPMRGDDTTWRWSEKVFEVVHDRGIDFFTAPRPEASKRWDTIVAAWLVCNFDNTFKGVTHRGEEFMTKGIPKEVLAKIGVEHDKDCCLSAKIAEAMYIDEDDPILGNLIKFTAERFQNPLGDALELHAIADAFYQTGHSSEYIWNWANTILYALRDWNSKFMEKAGADFMKATVVDVVFSREKRSPTSIKLVAGKSDCVGFGAHARSIHGCRAGVVIQENSSGNKQIFTAQRFHIDLTEVVQILRAEENLLAGRPVPGDHRLLGKEGEMPGCGLWYFFKKARAIFNGTISKKRPPTVLTLEEVTELVQIGLNKSRFAPCRAEQCKTGHCSHTDKNPCSWFDWHLHRCRYVRFAEHHGNQSRTATAP